MDKQAQHTPGPWWLHAEHSTLYVEGVAKDPRVTQEVAVVGPKEGGREQQLADARLIAAAPELFNALSVLADAAEARGIPVDAARAALAKARGDA